MPTKRFQPYQGRDGDHESLLNFALPAAQRLDPGFQPPKVLIAREDTEGMQDVMRYFKRWGDAHKGFETTHTVELEPKASGHAVDRMELSTFGLPEGCRLELECARVWHDPRFIEIRVEGPEAAVAAILADFEATFGGTMLDASQVRLTVVSAQVSLSVGANDAALMKAQQVLDVEPENVEALLVKAGAQQALGQVTESLQTLQQLVEIDPENSEAQALLAQISAK